MAWKKNLPAPASKIESEANRQVDRLREAAAIADPVSGFLFSLSRRAKERALRADGAAARALEDAANAHAGAISALINLRNRIDDYQAREELSPRFYELAKARAHAEIDQELARLGQRTAEARREQAKAKHGLQATRRNRDINYQLGDARKQAKLAEFIDLVPEPETKSASPGEAAQTLSVLQMAVAEALKLKQQRLADGEETGDIDKALELANEIFKMAGLKKSPD